MDHDQLIDLTRRALKLARDNTTDLAPQQHTVDARDYTSARAARPRQSLADGQSPTGRLCFGAFRSGRVLHQDGDGAVHPADPDIRRIGQSVRKCLPAPPVAGGDGVRQREAVHLPVPRVDVRQHRQAGRAAGPRRVPGRRRQIRRFDRTPRCRVRRIPLGGTGSRRHPGRCRRIWDRWPTNSTRGASDGGRRWARRCSTPRSTGNWRSIRLPRTITSPPCTGRRLPPSRAVTAPSSTPTAPITG